MGQYWEMICVDKRETFKLGLLLKLLEIMYCPPDGRGMAVLLAVRGGSHEAFGRWAGDRIVLLGDYRKFGDLPLYIWEDLGVKDPEATRDLSVDLEDITDLMPEDALASHGSKLLELCKEGDKQEWAAVNLETHELFTPAAFGHPNTLSGMLAVNEDMVGVPTMLPMLLASFPVGRGGGDPRSGHPMIGAWAANRVAILPKDVIATDLSTQQWGDALDFGLHNFTDVGADVQDMLMAELDTDGVDATVPPYLEPPTSFFLPPASATGHKRDSAYDSAPAASPDVRGGSR